MHGKDMTEITTEEILKATGGELLKENGGAFPGVSIDSRTIGDGEVYFALRGPRYDGHDFLDDALNRGSGAVVDRMGCSIREGKVLIYVSDTLRALQDLAHFLRKQSPIPVIAITGSNGKTTTKEMTCAILSERFPVLKNRGNLNNLIGLPLSITRLSREDRAAVLELGMNKAGEIKRLCEIAVPSHGVITNIGYAHVGELGSLDALRDAKLEILEGLTVAVLNADDEFLMDGYRAYAEIQGARSRLVTYGLSSGADVRAENIQHTDNGSSFTLVTGSGEEVIISLAVYGLFNVYNALAASAVSLTLGITAEEVKTALERYRSFSMRYEVIRIRDITVINDAYNANPSSVTESLKAMALVRRSGRQIVLLGDMYELGRYSEEAHRSVGREVSRSGIDVFVAVGGMMRFAADECRRSAGKKGGTDVHECGSAVEAIRIISRIIGPGDAVLVKGSRAMNMEKIVESFRR